jgi:hypothetical protein
MNKQKLISALQSRLSVRGVLIKRGWSNFVSKSYLHDKEMLKIRTLKLSAEQKLDKQLLRQLIVDERELKELREIRDTIYNEY